MSAHVRSSAIVNSYTGGQCYARHWGKVGWRNFLPSSNFRPGWQTNQARYSSVIKNQCLCTTILVIYRYWLIISFICLNKLIFFLRGHRCTGGLLSPMFERHQFQYLVLNFYKIKLTTVLLNNDHTHGTAAELDFAHNPKTTPEQPHNMILPAEQPRNSRRTWFCPLNNPGTPTEKPQNMILPAEQPRNIHRKAAKTWFARWLCLSYN